jgi:acyl carrier protein
MSDANVHNEVFEGIRQDLAQVLGCDLDTIQISSSLANDLGAESLDLLDILFRVQKRFSTRITMKEIQQRFRGNVSDEEFMDENGLVTEQGKMHLKETLPYLAPSVWEDDLEAKDLFGLFTVRFIVDAVCDRVEATQPSLTPAS